MTTKTNTAKKITETDEKKAKSLAISAKLKALMEKNKSAEKAEKKGKAEPAKKEGGKILDLKKKLAAAKASKPQPRTTLLKDKKEKAKCDAVGVEAVIGTGDSEGKFVTDIGNGAAELWWDDRADAIACALEVAKHIRTVAEKIAARKAE